MYEKIAAANTDFTIYPVSDEKFRNYGRIITTIDCDDLLTALEETAIPAEGNVYIASDPQLESLAVIEKIQFELFGGTLIQVGYCNGNSYQLNALEYHKCPEINLATEDIVLFLGKTSKIKNNTYQTTDVEAFYLPKGVMIELDGSTMHFAPCKTTNKGFKTLVILPKGTNEDFTRDSFSDQTLLKVNKWILTHPENERMVKMGAYPGLHGENYELKLA